MHALTRRPTYRQLQGFHAVVSAGSLKAGAAGLSISQAAMSKLIQSLEDDLGAKLFVTKRGGMQVSDLGRAVFAQSEVLFRSLAGIAELVQNLQSHRAGHLRIASVSMLSVEFLPALIAAFVKDRPEVAVELETFSSKEIVHLVGSRQVDIGLLSPPISTEGVDVVKSYRLRSKLITPRSSDFADFDYVTPEMLADRPFVSLSSMSLTRSRVDELFAALNIKRAMRLSARAPASISSFVLNGAGNAIVDPFTADEHVRRGGRAFTFRPAIPTSLFWVRGAQSAYPSLEDELRADFECRLMKYEHLDMNDSYL